MGKETGQGREELQYRCDPVKGEGKEPHVLLQLWESFACSKEALNKCRQGRSPRLGRRGQAPMLIIGPGLPDKSMALSDAAVDPESAAANAVSQPHMPW
jgi:hypothetical protein